MNASAAYEKLSPQSRIMVKAMLVWRRQTRLVLLLACFAWGYRAEAAEPQTVQEAVSWLQGQAKQMIHASRQTMKGGTAAFPPQVGAGYDAFWLRDYEYMLEGAREAFTDEDLKKSCNVFLGAQRADGACVDCVKYNGTPIYKPGFGTMGDNPVADGSQFTVGVAWHTYHRTKDPRYARDAVDGLAKALLAVSRNPKNGLVYIKPGGWDRCPYGFTDSVRKHGDELFCSLLFVQASRQLADLMTAANRPEDAAKWRTEADRVGQNVRSTFWDDKNGLFLAATIQCKQPDIWGSAFAVYLGVASDEQAKAVAKYFQRHYRDIVERGQIRHLPGGMYWEAAGRKDEYQNGAFWATPTGWFVYSLDLIDSPLADQTVLDLVRDLRRSGCAEWVLGEKIGVPNYVASAALPIAGIEQMLLRRAKRQERSQTSPASLHMARFVQQNANGGSL